MCETRGFERIKEIKIDKKLQKFTYLLRNNEIYDINKIIIQYRRYRD